MSVPIDIDRVCRTIAREAPDAIVYADAEGVIRLWNRGAERVFGFSERGALGKSLDIIIPEPACAPLGRLRRNDAEWKRALWCRRDSGGAGGAKGRQARLDRVHGPAVPR
jgi:PAS domain S-box-containing protein